MADVPIGLIAATAVGSEITQNTLDTFHTAGDLNNLVSSGFGRIVELFNNSCALNKTIITLSTTADLKNVLFSNFGDVAKNIQFIYHEKTQDYILSADVTLETQISKGVLLTWFEARDFSDALKLGNLRLSKISPFTRTAEGEVINTLYFSPTKSLKKLALAVEAHLQNGGEISNRILAEFYVSKIQVPFLKNIKISGIEGVERVHDTPTGKMLICSPLCKLTYELVQLDPVHITSNKAAEMAQIFGIEAARCGMIKELKRILPGVLPHHIILVVDIMTWGGEISSISRYTSRKDPDVLKRASFEELKRNIVQACISGEVDRLVSFSSKIVASKRTYDDVSS